MTEIFTFDDAFYEERGKPDGSRGAVATPETVSDSFREGPDSTLHFTPGGWEGGFGPSFVATLRTAREKIIAQKQIQDSER
jgi:hypothetical protein